MRQPKYIEPNLSKGDLPRRSGEWWLARWDGRLVVVLVENWYSYIRRFVPTATWDDCAVFGTAAVLGAKAPDSERNHWCVTVSRWDWIAPASEIGRLVHDAVAEPSHAD